MHGLEKLSDRASALQLDVIAFREPDLGDQLTSLAFVPHSENRRFLARLPLAGRRTGALAKPSVSTPAA